MRKRKKRRRQGDEEEEEEVNREEVKKEKYFLLLIAASGLFLCCHHSDTFPLLTSTPNLDSISSALDILFPCPMGSFDMPNPKPTTGLFCFYSHAAEWNQRKSSNQTDWVHYKIMLSNHHWVLKIIF